MSIENRMKMLKAFRKIEVHLVIVNVTAAAPTRGQKRFAMKFDAEIARFIRLLFQLTANGMAADAKKCF